MRIRTCIVMIAILLTCHTLAEAQTRAVPGDRTLYLIRHGWYDYKDPRDADVGKALLPLGVTQARLVGERLRALPVEINALYSSTMTRARETARVIGEEFPHLEVKESPLLRECTPPTWREDIMSGLEPGEADACREQLETAFAAYFVASPNGERHEVLVCHGNVIRYLVTRVLGVDTMAWLRMSIGNGSLTIVRIKPDGSMKLQMFADVGHVPTNLQTGLDDADRSLTVPGR